MLKKLFSIFLSGVFLVSSLGTAAAEVPNTANGKLGSVETVTYGQEQTGAIVERIKKLEKDYECSNTSGGMMNRINNLYDTTFDNSSSPSLITQLNALEWTISHKVSADPIQKRISDMELQINGKNSDASIKKRIEGLATFAFGSTTIPLSQVNVPANTLVKISLVTPINAKELKKGDIIKFKAAEDVIENDMLLITAGALGEGEVTDVSQAQNFGRDAKINIDFKDMEAVDGTKIDMTLGEEAKENMEQMGMAAGASLAGMIILGPIGIIGGAFVKGKNINLPEGTEMYLQTEKDCSIYAIPTTSAEQF
ncbi:hypothetical protein SAMN02745671_00033 [Anaerovibrio lipolyticus DSM 3074]|uniref:Uncharacterized protein n=1 Tax=Anaerovibrio lipolyticus DSM 3074 TaxID=1120997 RepID=A0A1M5ZX67_9FIRM|nr:hypothetical protein [Anaerovibrio lipolyticus]SHI28875.1 hypothetical protein SAMN02745671_00033 [Anaerovibrio lipolyticus DSM 3074]